MRLARGAGQPILWHATLVQAVTFSTRPTITYEAIDLGLDPAHLGALGAAFAVTPLFMALPAGRFVDQLGPRAGLFLGSALAVGGTLGLLVIDPSILSLLIASVLLGSAHLQSAVAQQAYVAASPVGRLDQAFGRYTFAASLGQAVGPMIVAWFGLGRVSPDTKSLLIVVLILGLTQGAFAYATDTAAGVSSSLGHTRGGARHLLVRPGVPSALAASAVVLAAVDLLLIYLPLLGSERGWSSFVVGLLLSLRGASSMVARLMLGRLTRKWGRRSVMTKSMWWTAVTLACLPVPMPTAILVPLILVSGFALGAVQPLTMSWLAERAPASQRGLVMALRLMGNRLGQVLLPTAAGLIAAGAGAGGVLWFCSASVGLVALVSTRSDMS